MIILPILTTLFIHLCSKGWENVLFELGSESTFEIVLFNLPKDSPPTEELGWVDGDWSNSRQLDGDVPRLQRGHLAVPLAKAVHAVAVVAGHEGHLAVVFVAARLDAGRHRVCRAEPEEVPSAQLVSEGDISLYRPVVTLQRSDTGYLRHQVTL